MARHVKLIGTLLLAAALGAGCSAGSTAGGSNSPTPNAQPTAGSAHEATGQPSAAADRTLRVGFIAAPANLDFTSTDGAPIAQAVLVNVYETLVTLDDSGAIVPLLAEKFEVSPDRKTYTFTLRPHVVFSNGAPFTADDVIFSINRVKSDWKPAVKARMDVVESVTKTDDLTVAVTLSRPSNNWLFAMTGRIGAMFSRTGVDNLATTAIGTGPYTVTSYNTDVEMVLERNDKYWGAKPAVKTAIFKYFKDASSMNNAMLGGTIDVLSTVQAPDTLNQFADTSKFRVIEGTTDGEVMLSFNHQNPVLKEKKVRQAISYALDRAAILKLAWAGKGTLIGSHVAPTDPWYEDLSGTYGHDVAKAKELLGGQAITLRLRVPNLPYATAAAPIIASQLAQVGITVQVDTLTFADWIEQVYKNSDYDMSIIVHIEPRDIGTVFGDPHYYTHYDNPKFRDLLAKADEGSPDDQVADMKQAAKMLADDAAAVWLWSLPNLIVTAAGIDGIPANAIGEAFHLAPITVS